MSSVFGPLPGRGSGTAAEAVLRMGRTGDQERWVLSHASLLGTCGSYGDGDPRGGADPPSSLPSDLPGSWGCVGGPLTKLKQTASLF